MNDKSTAVLGEAFLEAIRQAVRVEIQAALSQNGPGNKELITTVAPHPYFTIKEAAKFSRLGESTIRLYIRKRELKAHKVGERVIIKKTDLEKFLEGRPLEILAD